MLQKIYISNEWCSFEFYINKAIQNIFYTNIKQN